MDVEEEKDEGSEEESSEWEEYTDSEEEDTGPRLKPVFVRKWVENNLALWKPVLLFSTMQIK